MDSSNMNSNEVNNSLTDLHNTTDTVLDSSEHSKERDETNSANSSFTSVSSVAKEVADTSNTLPAKLSNATVAEHTFSIPSLDLAGASNNWSSSTPTPVPSDNKFQQEVEDCQELISALTSASCSISNTQPLDADIEKKDTVQNSDADTLPTPTSRSMLDLAYGTYLLRVALNGGQKEYFCHHLKDSDLFSISGALSSTSRSAVEPYKKSNKLRKQLKTVLTEEHQAQLELFYIKHNKYIRLKTAKKIGLALGLEHCAVQGWFTNKRANEKHNLRKEQNLRDRQPQKE